MVSELVSSTLSDEVKAQSVGRAILLVDDELPILNMLRDVLVDEGFPIITARSGVAALLLLQQTTVALVLMDFMMPGLNGLELAEQLRLNPQTAAIPLLLMSAVPPADVGSLFMAVISKPVSLDQVVQLIRQFQVG